LHRTAALWLAALFACASPAVAEPSRWILAQPQAEVMRACEAVWGEPLFQCVTWLVDTAGGLVCQMRVPLGLEAMNLERYEEVLGELREDCGLRVASR
jgi:hypothetical protein